MLTWLVVTCLPSTFLSQVGLGHWDRDVGTAGLCRDKGTEPL